MIVSKIKFCAAASSLVLAVALTGCSGSPVAPSPTHQPSGSGGSPSAPSPVGSSPSEPEEPAEASPTPPKPTPAASTSGPLSGDTMPKALLAFKAVPGEASEGEFQPNGTFVHALDPQLSVRDALPQCGSRTLKVPQATYALGASYRDGQDRPGNAVAFEFGSDAEARRWFQSFAGLVSDCEVVGTKPVITKTTLQDQRLSGESVWTEAGMIKDNRVTMVIVEGKEHSAKKLLKDLTG